MNVHAWRDAGAIHGFSGLDVFYRRGGSGPRMVLIHGFPTSSWDWRDVWPALAAGHDLLAMDLVGLGWSAKPARDLTVGLQADMVEALCEAQGFADAHLVAHDLGDTVAQELLARTRDGTARVRWTRCTLLNGGLFPETHRPLLVQKLLLSPLGPVVARLSSERRFRRSMADIFGTPPAEDWLAGSWELLVRDGGRAMLPRLIRYIEERRIHRERWVAPLVDKVVPTRLIVGTTDPISGGHMADRYAELVPAADVVRLDGVGHFPQVERPDAVVTALTR
jgi:pimeloyl-ACP methyl ester carboxylesterase